MSGSGHAHVDARALHDVLRSTVDLAQTMDAPIELVEDLMIAAGRLEFSLEHWEDKDVASAVEQGRAALTAWRQWVASARG
jgi:hypothetical protein